MILDFSFCGIGLIILWCIGTNALSSSKRSGVKNDIIKNLNESIPHGSIPLRQNILSFQNDRVSLSLLIQALISLQKKQNTDIYSYYQLAGKLLVFKISCDSELIDEGIHGRPYIPWNNVVKTPGTYDTGYCSHNSVLFLTWHRPYLAIVESSLIAEAQYIAKGYKNKSDEYVEAAKNLRLPYWDWAADPRLPEIATTPNIEINTWNGTQIVDNPLFQYKFNGPLDPILFPPNGQDGWFSQFSHTVRGANTKSPEEVNHFDVVNTHLQRNNIMSNTWRVLVKSSNFNSFSSTATPGLSLEEIHNNVHSSIGGRYGHMSYLSFSAFDPIFWLHHANIDRLFALWQVLNPDSYLEPQEDVFGNFVIPPHSIVDASTNLEPFRNSETGKWWTSTSVRDIKTFSYTYPELQGNQTGKSLKSSVTAAINRLYNPNSTTLQRWKNLKQDGTKNRRQEIKEWSLAMSVFKFDLGGAPFKVLFFMDSVPALTTDWEISDSTIGSVIIFPPPYSSAAGPLPQLITYAEIDLDDGLQRHGRDTMNVTDVIEFLQNQLEWRIQKMDGSPVPNDQVPSLNITLQDEVMLKPLDVTELPIYGEKTLHPDALKSQRK
ncbi:Tyrosinase [Golovinomyces cichoracearum]|uniref:tyrosinase n=1 Tax=Golovinomyces cichoracearum TaxID=62708 RepID=A0A420HLP9_9PEZI|nr:Tyrosinase [Golovinomyces cichoracearum]